jgi:hypothetical protein
MRGDQSGDDGQAQAAAAGGSVPASSGSGPGRVCSVETFEYPLGILFGKPGAVVANLEDHAPLCIRPDADHYRGAGWRVPDGIAHQVGDHLAQSQFVTDHDG